MDDKKKNVPYWQPAIAMFARISVWVAVPIIIALFLGKYLDTHFQTKPFIFLGLTGLAFLISIFGIWKILKEYINQMKLEDPSEKGKYKVYTDEDLDKEKQKEEN